MQSYYHNAGMGDIVYALQAIKELGGGKLYVGIDYDLYIFLKPLMVQQDYIHGFYHTTDYDLPKGFIDLTQFRLHPYYKDIHLVNLHRILMNLPETDFKDYGKGWLKNPGYDLNYDHSVINITPRYRDMFFKWDATVKRLQKYGPVYFVGFYKDYKAFVKPEWKVLYSPVETVHDGILMVYSAKYFVSNESFWLAVRQGYGLSYQVEKHPFGTHVITNNEDYETVLNPLTNVLHRDLSLIKKYTVGYTKKILNRSK